MDGVKYQLSLLPDVQSRIRFLSMVVYEMSDPIGFLIEGAPENPDGHSSWNFLYKYRHAISWEELDRLRQLLHDLKTEDLATFRHEVVSLIRGEQYQVSGKENTGGGEPLAWEGTQTDLVYIMDCLREAGFLDSPDSAITEHFNYGGAAKDKAKTYRDLRKKIREGSSHPDRTRIEKLIAVLQRELI
jgi:hypothetical protein